MCYRGEMPHDALEYNNGVLGAHLLPPPTYRQQKQQKQKQQPLGHRRCAKLYYVSALSSVL